MPNREGKSRPRHSPQHSWWSSLIAAIATVPFLILIVFLMVIVPPFAVVSLWDEHRLRRFYRRAGRFLEWEQARERLAAGRGTLLVEVAFKGLGHVWWLDTDLRADDPDCPLVAARALHPKPVSGEGIKAIFMTDNRHGCEDHLPKLADAAHLVRVPRKLWKQWDEVLSGGRALAVFFERTHCFYRHRRR